MEQAPSKTSDITHLTRHKQNERHYAKPQAKPSFRLQDCSWAQLLRASRTHKNKEVSWLTPQRGSGTSRTAAFHHTRSAPLCCGLLALSLSLPSAFILAPLLAWHLIWYKAPFGR